MNQKQKLIGCSRESKRRLMFILMLVVTGPVHVRSGCLKRPGRLMCVPIIFVMTQSGVMCVRIMFEVTEPVDVCSKYVCSDSVRCYERSNSSCMQ